MSLRPEQERALAYLERRGTRETAEVVRDRVRRALGALEAVLAKIDASAAHRRPGPGRWCVQEVVDHLAESHRLGAEQIAAVIVGEDPGEAVPAHLLSADPLAKSWPEAVAALEKVHRRFLSALESADDTTSLERKLPLLMVVKVAEPDGGLVAREWIVDLDWKAAAAAFAAHTREHQAQIERTVAGDAQPS